MAFLFDPRFFNFVIMALYTMSAVRWAFAGRYADMCYWLSALAITSVCWPALRCVRRRVSTACPSTVNTAGVPAVRIS